MDILKMKVFPAADVFPKMHEEDLIALSEDIKANGLREPLVIAEIDGETVLVDGRNRRDACKLAGVKPETRELNGEDPTAFVISANIHRRNITKGQQAMAVAKIYPEPEKGGRGQKSLIIKGFNQGSISQARTVISYASDKVDGVLSGITPLDEAYKEARARKDDATNDDIRLAKLRKKWPELADKVVEGELTLDGACAEAKARVAQEREQIELCVFYIVEGMDKMALMGNVEKRIEAWLTNPGTAGTFKEALNKIDKQKFEAGVNAVRRFLERVA